MILRQNKPPKHLSWDAKKIWREVALDFDLEPATLLVLKVCLESYDRFTAARELIDREGTYYITANGFKRPHPGCQVEKEARAGFLQAWRALGLTIDPPGKVGRPAKY